MEQTKNGETLNVLQRAAQQQALFAQALENLSGYRCKTSFFGDLTIAEASGFDAIRQTCKQVRAEWGKNYEYYTEFVLALNHKIWFYYKKNEPLARLYDELWRDADAWAMDNYTGDAIAYYLETTD